MAHLVHNKPLPNNIEEYDVLQEYYKDGYDCADDFNFTTHVLDKWATDPSLLALYWVNEDYSKEVKLTYAQLSDLSHRTALVFSEKLGLKKGDTILIQTPRIWQWWVIVLGLIRLGVIPIPGTSLLLGKDLKYRATVAHAHTFIGDATACGRAEQVASEAGFTKIIQVDESNIGPNRVDFLSLLKSIPEGSKFTSPVPTSKADTSMIYFTSGTTGDPKMVLMTAEYTLGHRFTGHWYRLKPNTLFLNMADLGWAKTAYSTFAPLNLGATIFVHVPRPGNFNPVDVADLLNKFPIEVICCPPTIYRSLVSIDMQNYIKERPFQKLGHCVSAGEPLNASVIEDWYALTNITIADGWGQTETNIMVGNYKGVKVRPGSMGKPTPGYLMAVIDENANELGPDEEGEMSVRVDAGVANNYIFQGYVKKDGSIDKRRKKSAKTGRVYYTTGDRGTYDADGYFWFVGRDDDVITSSGYRIGPFEVESALKEHPSVLESAAVASPDLKRNEIVKAFITLSDEYKHVYSQSQEEQQKLKDELVSFFKSRTAPYKVPREIEFMPLLPKTISGKIRRVDLRNAEYAKKKDVVEQLMAGRRSKL